MEVVGYDEAVAESNGYEIVENKDGSWESVPVTPEAQAFEDSNAGPSTRTVTVGGNYGSSWIDVSGGINPVKTVRTGYNVPAPVANRISWVVQVSSFGGFPSMSWPSGPSGAQWSGVSSFSTGGIGGFAWVTPTSSVLLIDGRVCSSGSPAEGY